MNNKISRLQSSRDAVKTRKSVYDIVPNVLNNDEEQILSLLYAPSRSGFPDCSLAAVLHRNGSESVRQFTERLMYKGADNGSPDVDAALNTVIPSRAQYGTEYKPFLEGLQNFMNDLKIKKHDKDQ